MKRVSSFLILVLNSPALLKEFIDLLVAWFSGLVLGVGGSRGRTSVST